MFTRKFLLDPRMNHSSFYSSRQTPNKQQEESLASRRQRNLVDLIQQVRKK